MHFFNIRTSKSGANMRCFAHFHFEMCFAPQRRAHEPPKVARTCGGFVHFDFEMCFAPQRRALFRHLNFQKWSEHAVFLYILTSKCASRHNGVHFFDISTAKSGPKLVCFVHFDFEMCFAPQTACTFFDISTSKSRPTLKCFAHFDFEMCCAPQRRALFSTSQLPKVVRAWCVLYILTSKCASRHNGVQIFHLSSGQLAPHPPL